MISNGCRHVAEFKKATAKLDQHPVAIIHRVRIRTGPYLDWSVPWSVPGPHWGTPYKLTVNALRCEYYR